MMNIRYTYDKNKKHTHLNYKLLNDIIQIK